MARGREMGWLSDPPWWAWALMVVSVAWLAVGIPIALNRGGPVAGAGTTPTSTATTETTTPSAAPTPFQPPASPTLDDTFTGRARDTIETAATGQVWKRTGSNPLVLTDAGMTIDGTGAGYTTTDLAATPASLGASVVFEDGDPGAVATLLVSKGPGLDLDNMGVHYYFDATGWTLQVRENGENPFPVIDSGTFTTPLTTDGATVYTVNITIAGDTLTVTHADGTTTTVTDPRVGLNVSGNVAWEVFRSDAGMARPAFQRVWATV